MESTRISPLNNRYAKPGITLIELSLVIFLVGVLLGFSLPNFSVLFESKLLRETKRTANLIQQVRYQALLGGDNFILAIDPKRSEIRILKEDREIPGKFVLVQTTGESFKYEPPIEIHSLQSGYEEEKAKRFGPKKLQFKKIFGMVHRFRIDASGFTDTFTVRLTDSNKINSLSVTDIMGTIRIEESLQP